MRCPPTATSNACACSSSPSNAANVSRLPSKSYDLPKATLGARWGRACSGMNPSVRFSLDQLIARTYSAMALSESGASFSLRWNLSSMRDHATVFISRSLAVVDGRVGVLYDVTGKPAQTLGHEP